MVKTIQRFLADFDSIFCFSDLVKLRQIFRSKILTRKKIPLGFSYSRHIKNIEWSPIFDSGSDIWISLNLLSKHVLVVSVWLSQIAANFSIENIDRKKKRLGFSYSIYIKKPLWSHILDPGLQFREWLILRDKNFAKIQSPTEVQAGIDCRVTPESVSSFYWLSKKQ